MGILDVNEDPTESDIEFDNDSKIRLFETHQKTSKGVHDYIRKFLPVAVAAIVILVVFGFFMTPRAGDEVRAPDEVYNAVYEHIVTKEKRSISEAKFYKCEGYYWVQILAEPKPFPPSNPEDPVNQYRLAAQQSGSVWSVETLQKSEKDVPCVR
jgi:hypothetical protein